LRGDGTLQTLSQSHGLPLGIYKEKPYRSSITELHPDDTMILYTDGVINSVDSKNQYYGTDRLEKNLINLSGMTSQEIVEKLVNSLTIFEGEGRQADDISILALKINEKRPET
jgi:sigma-B regulation protein RsbU (phosphoserine phosphatase)